MYYITPVQQKTANYLLDSLRLDCADCFVGGRIETSPFLFNRLGRYCKISIPKKFNIEEFYNKIKQNPTCYLTGSSINLTDTQSYSLDHKIPVSKNGDNNLENLGLCSSEVNRAKSDKTPEEFFQLCKEVLEYNGYTVIKKENGGCGKS